MADDPYAALGSPVEGNAPSQVAPQADDPYAQFGTSAGSGAAPPPGNVPPGADPADHPAQKVAAGYTKQAGFEDTLPAHAHPMPPELEHTLLDILANDPLDTAASHARQVAAQHGYSVGPSTDPHYADSVAQAIAYRRQHGAISDSIITQLAPAKQDYILQGDTADAARSFLRGAASFLPMNTLNSALHAGVDAISGNAPDGIAADFNRWSDINYGTQLRDEEHHGTARLVGQLIGGLAIPSGFEGAALNAGKSVLKAGGSMVEARAAAAAAARMQLAKEGAVVGTSHGFDSAAPGQGIPGAIVGGVTGGAGGYALAKVGQTATSIAKSLSGVGNAAEEAATQPQSYVQLARDLNIRRTPATNSKSGVATVVQAGLGALPGGAPIGKAAERETGDLASAVKGVAEGVGTVSNRQGAGEAVAQGAQTYAQESKAAGKALYGQRDSAMGGEDAPVSLDNFGKSVNDLAQQFPNSPALQQLREHPVIRQVTGALGQAANSEDGQVTLGQATEALSHVRGVLRNLQATNSASPVVISRVAGVEQALENDVMSGARAADQAMGRVPGSEGSAVKAQQDADKFWADRASALNGSLKRPMQSAKDDTKVSGEAVYNQLLGDMNIKSGNLARLRDTWFRLPGKAKSTFAATAIDDLGRAAPGQQNDTNTAWSFNRFLTNLNTMSPQARNIVFGAKADADLQKIAAYADRLRQLDKARNFSNTAKTYFAGAFMATVGGAVLHGDFSAAGDAAMAIPATWGGARLLLATPAMRDWTSSAMRAAVSGNETAMKVLTKRLGSIASAEPAIASDLLGLQKAIMKAANDNGLRQVAASPDANSPQKKNGNQPVVP